MSRQLHYYQRNARKANERTRIRRTKPPGRASYMVCTCRTRAKKKGWDFDLTTEWILERLERGCALTGREFNLVAGARAPDSPSVDRIDSTKGYTQKNCRVILWGLNAAFGTWGENAFQDIALAWLGVKEQNTQSEKQAT